MNNGKLIRLVKLPTINDDGFLTIGQHPDIPFDIKRVYYIYDCVPNLLRGKHAHLETQQILFCLRGSVRMQMDDGQKEEGVILNDPRVGIIIDRLIWHDMCEIQKDTLLLVLASDIYKPEDYVRDYQLFIRKTREEKRNKIKRLSKGNQNKKKKYP